MEYVKAPDFPTGGYIYGMSGVRDAYETGRGRVVMRAKTEIETDTNHDKIIVTEIPYGVNKAELIKYIAGLVSEKKIDGISNVNDESDKDGMRIVIDVKRDANASVVLNKLFKMTQLQTAFSVNSVALIPCGEGNKLRPKVLCCATVSSTSWSIVTRWSSVALSTTCAKPRSVLISWRDLSLLRTILMR